MNSPRASQSAATGVVEEVGPESFPVSDAVAWERAIETALANDLCVA